MAIKEIKDYLPEHPFFEGMDEDLVEFLAGCATNVHFGAGGILFKEGDAADTFYVIRKGRVAIQVHEPTGGGILDTVEDGGVVGWSWLVPPFTWLFDATASTDVSAIAFDGGCLRTKCADDPAVGYVLMQRVATVMFDRLEAARMRLIDMYGDKESS